MGRLGETKEVSDIEGETSTVGLYDVCTVARIAPLLENAPIDEKSHEWKLKPKSNDRFLVLASCSDLAVFTLGERTEYSFNTGLDGQITDHEILGNSAFLVGILDKRRVIIFSLDKQEIYFNEETPIEVDFVFCNPTPSVCYLTFGSRSGEWSTVMLPGDVATSKETNPVENWQRDQIQEFFQNGMQKSISTPMSMQHVSGDISQIASGPLSSFVSVDEQNGVHWCALGDSKFTQLGKEKRFVRVRDGGRYSLHLDSEGWIHVFDPLTLCFWHEFDVKLTPEDQILDFVVIDRSEVDVPKLFAIVSTSGVDGATQMMLYDRVNKVNCFALSSSTSTTLFAYGGSNRVLMAVEEVNDENAEQTGKGHIVVRQVSQSRPEMRFESLLKSNRFEEAEQFAKTFKLDLQKVYKGHVNYLMDACDENDEAFDTLMRTMELITDHNMVAETYFTLVGMSRRCDRVRTYLTSAKKRRVSDMEILNMIETLCHIWGTYRIINGPNGNETNTQIDEDIWDLFVEALHGTNPWIEMYNQFILSAQFTQARVIFSRHGKSIVDYLCLDDEESSSRIDALFRLFADAISADITKWSNVIEHVTTDIFPACIEIFEELVPRLENLIVTLVPLLEYRDSEHWPDNAIKAASSYGTMSKILANDGQTPASQCMFLLCGSKLISSTENGSSSMSRIKKIYYDLLELKRLKEVYQCQISFPVFQSLTAEGICHKILQNALANPNTTHAKIEKFVKPFMAERHLDQEQTIVNYIQMMAGAAVSKANIFGWEKQCVQLCDSLMDESRRCCSIISIASTAKLPWPVELNEAVEKILASRTLLRCEIEEMQQVCRRTELYKMLSSYGYSRHDIELLTLPDAEMDVILTIRCMLAQREKTSRFVDIIRLLDLLKSMQTSNDIRSVRIEYVQSHAIIHMMTHDDVTTSIINYIDNLGDRERVKTINMVFSFISCVADMPAAGTNVLEREKLLGVGEELLSFYACRDNEFDDPHRRLKDDLVLLREMQKDEDKAVLLSDLKSEEWQQQFVVKLLESNSSLSVKLGKCDYMGVRVEHLIEILLDKLTSENDINATVECLTDYVDYIKPWTNTTHQMLWPLVNTLSWVTFRLPELSPHETEIARADDIADIIKRLGRIVGETIRKFSFEVIHEDLNYLLQLEAFFNLADNIVRQSLRGQGTDIDKQETYESDDIALIPSPSLTDTSSSASATKLRIFDVKRSLGTYGFSSDPALFEGVQGVLALAQVAPSVARPYESDISAEDANEFRSNWEQLNMFLAMHSQDLLDISARVFAGSLKCWSGEYRQGILELEQPVLSVVERMLIQKKFDFWHAVTLLGGIPAARIDQMVVDLQRKPGVKSSTKAMIQYLRLAFVMSLLTRNMEKVPMIITFHERKFLEKKLAEEGIRVPFNSPEFVDKVLQQAVDLKQTLSPVRLHEYVKMYVEKLSQKSKIKVGEYMVRYATLLIRKASLAGRLTDKEVRKEEVDRYIELARISLRLAVEEDATCICNYLHCLLYIVCPYNYEVIQFIVTAFGQYATETGEQDFHKNLKTIMTFLWSYRRTNHISKEESLWFTKREHKLVKDEKEYEKTGRFLEPFGHSIRMSYETENDGMSDTINSDSSYPNDAMIYEKNSVIISDIPILATKYLPFHAFLLRRKEETDETVMGIVKAELSIFNVPVWQAFLRDVAWLVTRFSRSQLLSSAIFAHANKYAVFGKNLPEGERATIYHLLNSASQRKVVVSTIALLFKRIALSDVKIELLQMGVDISDRWTADLTGEDRQEMEEQSARLKDGIANFFTELELRKNGLYNEKTADNVENVQELCTYIYDEMVDWGNSDDVAKKCEVVEKIARANNLDLSTLHEQIVFGWVESTETSVVISHADMNESIGGTSFIDQNDDSDDQNEFRMPLFDKVLDKVVVLCQRIDKKKLLTKLGTILVRGGRKANGGFTAVVRATCIIMRSFTDKDVSEFSPDANLITLCSTLEIELYDRLFEKAEVKFDRNADKVQLVKTLLQCPSRTHPMTSLIACLIIDHDFKDPKSIEQVMTRLQISKQWSTLRALLSYVRTNHMDSLIRSFPLLWFRVYENAVTELNGGSMVNSNWSYEQCVLFRKWTLWAMSSNVEGGRQPSVTRFLREIGCPISSSVVSVLSNWTVDKMDEVDTSKIDEDRDLPLEWKNGGKSASVNNSIA